MNIFCKERTQNSFNKKQYFKWLLSCYLYTFNHYYWRFDGFLEFETKTNLISKRVMFELIIQPKYFMFEYLLQYFQKKVLLIICNVFIERKNDKWKNIEEGWDINILIIS